MCKGAALPEAAVGVGHSRRDRRESVVVGVVRYPDRRRGPRAIPVENAAAGAGPRRHRQDHGFSDPILRGLGTVQAFNTVTVKSRVDGNITRVAFVEGHYVKKGDLLLQINPRPYQAQLQLALANEAKDKANLANAQQDLARYAALLPNPTRGHPPAIRYAKGSGGTAYRRGRGRPGAGRRRPVERAVLLVTGQPASLPALRSSPQPTVRRRRSCIIAMLPKNVSNPVGALGSTRV